MADMDEQTKQEIYSAVSQRADELKALYSKRDSMLKEIEDMIYMRETAHDKALRSINPDVALTKSADEAIAVKGVIRLTTSAAPRVKIPKDKNLGDKTGYEMAERFGDAILAGSDRVTRKPAHENAIVSATYYGAVCYRIVCTQDDLDALDEDDAARKQAGEQEIAAAIRKRVEDTARLTPYRLEYYNIRSVYPEFDRYGLRSVLIEVTMTLAEVCERWPTAKEYYQDYNKHRLDVVTVHDYTDLEHRCIYILGKGPVYVGELGLPFIPLVYELVEGTDLVSDAVDQYEPFLRTVWASKMDQRTTEIQTAWATELRAYGLNPTIKLRLDKNGQRPTQSTEGLTQVWEIGEGGEVEYVQSKGLTDPSAFTALQYIKGLKSAATVYETTIGGGANASDTYSAIALTSQIGRLPIDPIKRAAERALANGVEIVLEWARYNKKKISTYTRKGIMAAFDPATLPEKLHVEVLLKVDLPQDKAQNSRIATEIYKGGLASREWVQENILDIEQPDDMWRQVTLEQAVELIKANKLQAMVQALMQMMAPKQPAAPQPGGGAPVGIGQGGTPMQAPGEPAVPAFEQGQEQLTNGPVSNL